MSEVILEDPPVLVFAAQPADYTSLLWLEQRF